MSIAAQLQAIKSKFRGAEPDPLRRPLTRPSVLFDPKEAADIDIRTILPISISGLEVLIGLDSRFERYRDTLFSNASLEVDRDKLVPKEEEKLNKSVTSYLRLLAGHLQLPAALKTLEYLIRRYRVYAFNSEELILCALPYHDTHVFVRIVQLIDLESNKKWAFLEGVKSSGAPPPRKVIVQQCLRDKGVLEAVCNYASPTKHFAHSRPVICFSTAVIVEALGSVQRLDDDTVKRVLPFVLNGMDADLKGGRDDKAGALMVVGLLASRSTLAFKLTNSLISGIARMARREAEESEDLPWLRIILMSIISLVQSHSYQAFPEKSLKILVEIRDIAGVLAGLSQDFNIEKFLSIFLETLADNSCSDETCCVALNAALDIIPVKSFVGNIVAKLLKSCLKLSTHLEEGSLLEAGSRVKRVLHVIDQKYCSELRSSIRSFLENSKKYSMEEDAMLKALCLMLGSNLDSVMEISDSHIWLSLEHPKASICRDTLHHLSSSGLLKAKSLHPQMLANVQDALLRHLHDDDLTVVQAVLSIDGLVELINPLDFLVALGDVLDKCIDILKTGTSNVTSEACEVAVTCLNSALSNYHAADEDYAKGLAKIVFRLLLILPKTLKVNLKALELAKKIQWPLYYIFGSCDFPPLNNEKNLEANEITSLNLKIVRALAKDFIGHPEEFVTGVTEFSRKSHHSKILFLYVMLQSVLDYDGDLNCLLKIFGVCFPLIKEEWNNVEHTRNVVLKDHVNLTSERLDSANNAIMDELLGPSIATLDLKISLYVCWEILRGFALSFQNNLQNVEVLESSYFGALSELLAFFSSSPLKNVFREHYACLVTKCISSPVMFLSRFFTEDILMEVQLESLYCYANICSAVASADTNVNADYVLELLIGFPSLLVPLSSRMKELRSAAMNCVDGLYTLWHGFDISRLKNGSDTQLIHCVSAPTFGKLLHLINQQQKLILSDVNFLPSLMSSIFCPSSERLCVPKTVDKRFDQQEKDTILFLLLRSVFTMSSFAKLMVLQLLKGIGNALFKIDQVKLLFDELIRRQNCHIDKQNKRLSETEVHTLCLLLETSTVLTVPVMDVDTVNNFLNVLKVGTSLEEPALIKPCLAALQNLSGAFYGSLKQEIQDDIFSNIVLLLHNGNSNIRCATKEAVLRITIGYSTVAKLIEMVICKVRQSGLSKRKKPDNSHLDNIVNGEALLSFLSSLLDIILMKKDMSRRELMVKTLFHLLSELFSTEWIRKLVKFGEGDSEGLQKNNLEEIPPAIADVIAYAQQTTFVILEDICATFGASLKDEIQNNFDIDFLIDSARSTSNAVTRNHIFMLLSALARISSDWVSNHILNLFSVIAESAIKQNDSQSHRVVEVLISTVVPCWLTETDGINNLLKVFVDVLPQVAPRRRLALMLYLLRTLGEKSSLGPLLYLLFCSVTQRRGKYLESDINVTHNFYCQEWEYLFAAELCSQMSCSTWLPCLVSLLNENPKDTSEQYCFVLLLVMGFISDKLRDTELAFELESGDDAADLQCMLGELMERIILKMQDISTKSVKSRVPKNLRTLLKELERSLVKVMAKLMVPSEYFKCMTKLLGHANYIVIEKSLHYLCDFVKSENISIKTQKQKRNAKKNKGDSFLFKNEDDEASFEVTCLQIIHLVDGSESSLKLDAILCVEAFAQESLLNDGILIASLRASLSQMHASDSAISCGSICCAGTLIHALKSKALPELPIIMNKLLKCGHDASSCFKGKLKKKRSKSSTTSSDSETERFFHILSTLEAVVDNLGCFLNPYLEDIIKLLLLHPMSVSESDPKIKAKAAAVRKLSVEKIPVRLILPPLLKLYPASLNNGESSLSFSFGMLADVIETMDRPSIGSYYKKIFEHCLLALDLRRQCPESIKNISTVEQNIINAMVRLTMKLTESMFRPVFLQSLDWAESELESNASKGRSIERMISFYSLVNTLAEQQRSLFVPYFKYLINGIMRSLTDDPDTILDLLPKKRKKTKTSSSSRDRGRLSHNQWCLRALTLASLYKCFLYDTGNLKFLDANNFQLLLKPIVSQLAVEPPDSLEDAADIPSTHQVNEYLVNCLGQMAVAAGHDDNMWKQLNHEVLMQTRSEEIRPRILGLRVVKYLLDHLKEEYLVLLPETIPFLGELLEDMELSVKSLAQDIFRELEMLSGENLQQYL